MENPSESILSISKFDEIVKGKLTEKPNILELIFHPHLDLLLSIAIEVYWRSYHQTYSRIWGSRNASESRCGRIRTWGKTAFRQNKRKFAFPWDFRGNSSKKLAKGNNERGSLTVGVVHKSRWKNFSVLRTPYCFNSQIYSVETFGWIYWLQTQAMLCLTNLKPKLETRSIKSLWKVFEYRVF